MMLKLCYLALLNGSGQYFLTNKLVTQGNSLCIVYSVLASQFSKRDTYIYFSDLYLYVCKMKELRPFTALLCHTYT